jgi:hypothetical protein
MFWLIKWWIKDRIRYLKWVYGGRKVVIIVGTNCGCCGRYINEVITIPEYKSCGSWWDGWSLCEGECLD